MSEFVTIFLVLLGVIVIAAVVFCAWLVVMLIKGVLTGLSRLLGFGASSRQMMGAWRQCGRRACRADNPMAARFCRRCGHPMNPDLSRSPRGF